MSERVREILKALFFAHKYFCRRAEQIGVEKYMGKPYNEVDLIDSISELLPTKV